MIPLATLPVRPGVRSPACSAIVHPFRFAKRPTTAETYLPACSHGSTPQSTPQQLSTLLLAQPSTYSCGSSRPRFCCRHTRMIARRLPLSIQVPPRRRRSQLGWLLPYWAVRPLIGGCGAKRPGCVLSSRIGQQHEHRSTGSSFSLHTILILRKPVRSLVRHLS